MRRGMIQTAPRRGYRLRASRRSETAPVEDARHFVEKLRSVSHKPALYIEMQGAEHAFDVFPSVRTVPVIEATEHYLDSIHRAYLEGKRDAVGGGTDDGAAP